MSREGGCSVSDCPLPIKARGMCNAHYLQARKGVDLTPVRNWLATPNERLERNSVRSPEGCRVWIGHIGVDGYGRTKFEGVTRLVHRIAYSLHNDDLEDHETINHLCGNRACSEPTHLIGASRLENGQYITVGMDSRGVSLHSVSGKWRARVGVNWTSVSLGLYETKAEAVSAVREYRKSLPELARVNQWEAEYLAGN